MKLGNRWVCYSKNNHAEASRYSILLYRKSNRWTQQTQDKLVWRVATASTPQLCSSLWSSFLFVSCRFTTLKLSPRRMLGVLVSSCDVSGVPVSCLCQSTYTSVLGRCTPLFPLLSLVPIFPLHTSSESCVLLHSFSLFLLSWGIFASRSPLDSPATY